MAKKNTQSLKYYSWMDFKSWMKKCFKMIENKIINEIKKENGRKIAIKCKNGFKNHENIYMRCKISLEILCKTFDQK